MIGTPLNQYRITASIGAGGMGEVFRARDTRLNCDVARSRSGIRAEGLLAKTPIGNNQEGSGLYEEVQVNRGAFYLL